MGEAEVEVTIYMAIGLIVLLHLDTIDEVVDWVRDNLPQFLFERFEGVAAVCLMVVASFLWPLIVASKIIRWVGEDDW